MSADLTSRLPIEDLESGGDTTLSAEELLMGAQTRFELVIPAAILQSRVDVDNSSEHHATKKVMLRPISLKAFQLILNSGKQDKDQIPMLLIREAIVVPRLSLEQIGSLHIGLVNFLVEQIQSISGISQ